ncbi:hypothetical protein Nepgr_026619 [Nepenthes gracilis]|uniref:Uncharacterized protein n=1 Tax=Nepenthes gracilis TaxID=150966 RepID=A0AAD3T8V7_NEPGR|nr:hypothetical protein Nepgr_026619 [Nepenthes gracilis]
MSLASRLLVVIRRKSLIQGFLSCFTMASCVFWFVCFHCSGVGCEAGKLFNDVVWTVLLMVSSTECSEIWWLKTNYCSYAGYAGGGDGPVWWASFTGDG